MAGTTMSTHYGSMQARMSPISRPPLPWDSNPYPERSTQFVPVVRQSSPAQVPSRSWRVSIEPVFSIKPVGVNWKKLPSNVLNLVLGHLENLHLGPRSGSCSTCYMRDLTSVQLACKAWFSDAQRMLYSNIKIIGNDDPAMLLKWKLSRAARLIRLRSTLRSRHLLAQLVKTLHVPDLNIPLYKQNGDPNPEYDAYVCTLASVVMACPNLEALTGFYPFYNHTFDRLTHALSTRRRLRQHVWIIAENDDITQRGLTQLPPGLVDETQSYQFLIYHDRWKHLETLMLCSPGGLGVIEHELFIRMLHSLRALRNLCISSFDPDDFHDMTLLSLPPWVTSLRLEECLGVTDAGLRKWAPKPNAGQIEKLSLIHQNISSLRTISRIFASMDRLEKFSIVQNDVIPEFPLRHLVVQPVLSSKSLRFLHWDISHPKPRTASGMDKEKLEQSETTPNMLLALSITHRGFPSLTTLRAPRDTAPLGILQSVCLPFDEGILLPDDETQPYNYQQLRRSSSLRAARLRAQRVDEHSGRSLRTAAPSHNHLEVNNTTRGQKSASDTSTATFNSLATSNSRASNKSIASTSTNRNPQDMVSPIGSNPDAFSPLAPDDGIVSPIAVDQDQTYPAGQDADKQVIAGPERRRKPVGNQNTNRDSICRCTPDPAASRNSVCLCEVHDKLGETEQADTTAPPPRSVFRPQSPEVKTTEHPRTRFPSLIKTKPRQVPRFYLIPDAPNHDGNGGIVGWGDLMRISEKARMTAESQKKADDESHDPKIPVVDESDTESEEPSSNKFCTGPTNRNAMGQLVELPILQKILSGSSTNSNNPDVKGRPRSKSKSSSRLSLSLLRSAEKETMPTKPLELKHVARRKGPTGGCVDVQDFF